MEKFAASGTPIAAARLKTKLAPVMTSLSSKLPVASRVARTITSDAEGAIPMYFVPPPLPAAIDATCVPWPFTSVGTMLVLAWAMSVSMSLPVSTAP